VGPLVFVPRSGGQAASFAVWWQSAALAAGRQRVILSWRLGYSTGQIFWTHQDSGRTNFNFSEVVGNSTAVAISNIYYKDDRTAHDAVSSLGVQLGVDMATNILKEFWPDFDHKIRRKHSDDADAASHK
jgi:hypothetical protein